MLSLTNMSNPALPIDHNIPVVSVFDLKNIAKHGIGCHALYEIIPRFLEGHAVCWTELEQKKGGQVIYFCSAHLVS